MTDVEQTTERPNGAVRSAVETLASEIGEDPSAIRVLDPKWVQYLRAGCKVELHIGRWRAETTLTHADLGLRPASDAERQAWEALLLLGRRLLLPRAVLARAEHLEAQARYWLERNAFRTHWGFFVPAQRYPDWKRGALELREIYLGLGAEIVESWDALQEQVRADYRTLGRENYRRLVAAGLADLPTVDDWIDGFIERALRAVPPREAVGRSFTFSWEVAYLPLASLLAEDQARAEAILVEAEAARQAADARSAALREMERDILAGAKQRTEALLDAFIADVQGQLRARVYDVCLDVLDALGSRSGRVPRGSVRQLKHLVAAVERLKFWDDTELERQMAAIRGLLGRRPEQRSAAEVQRAIARIGAESRLALLELDRAPARSGRALGIPDELPALEAFVRRERSSPTDLLDVLQLQTERQARRPRSGALPGAVAS